MLRGKNGKMGMSIRRVLELAGEGFIQSCSGTPAPQTIHRMFSRAERSVVFRILCPPALSLALRPWHKG